MERQDACSGLSSRWKIKKIIWNKCAFSPRVHMRACDERHNGHPIFIYYFLRAARGCCRPILCLSTALQRFSDHRCRSYPSAPSSSLKHIQKHRHFFHTYPLISHFPSYYGSGARNYISSKQYKGSPLPYPNERTRMARTEIWIEWWIKKIYIYLERGKCDWLLAFCLWSNFRLPASLWPWF